LSETETDEMVKLLTQLKLRRQQNDATRIGISLSYLLYQPLMLLANSDISIHAAVRLL